MATVHIGRFAGAGGFARTVAIKRLHPEFARDPEFVAMLLDEARLAARVRHLNVVATLDLNAYEGELFLVMEYVHGEALAKLIGRASENGKAVPPPIAAAILSGTLHGLHAAHEARDEQGALLGVVHRDVSPQNILVGSDGVARLVDFGIAKARGRLQTTRIGEVKGKVRYMSPEQRALGTVTRQSDIYSAAIVFWEMLTGRRMAIGESDTEAISSLECEKRAPGELVPGLPEELDRVVLRALADDPAERYATARAMALAIEHAIAPAPVSRVAEWVNTLAADTLEARAARVAQVERDTTTSPSLTFVAHSAIDLAVPPVDQVLDPAPRTRFAAGRRLAWAFGATALVAAVAWYHAYLPGPGATSATPAEGVNLAETVPPSLLSPPETPHDGQLGASPPAESGLPKALAPRVPLPASRSRSDSARKAEGRCDMPFVVDSLGHKTFKVECL
jgi:serine/threonine-protein kinase